jgi:hypothetical protein
MTEPEPSAHDEQVRRLLADARHDAPIPAGVAARLDGVLADLAAERAAPPVPPPPLGPPAPVVDLAARRRRRQGAAMLVAAAAVVAIGIGVGTVVDRSPGGDSAGGSAESSESFDRGTAQEREAGGAAEPSSKPAPSDTLGELARVAPVPVSSDTFAADAERYRSLSRRQQKPGAAENDHGFDCAPADFGAGVLVPVIYDGREAVLAYRPPTDDAQVVDLLQCGTGDVVRTTTLPVP